MEAFILYICNVVRFIYERNFVETEYFPVIRFKGGDVSTQMGPLTEADSMDKRTLTERDPISALHGKILRKLMKSSQLAKTADVSGTISVPLSGSLTMRVSGPKNRSEPYSGKTNVCSCRKLSPDPPVIQPVF